MISKPGGGLLFKIGAGLRHLEPVRDVLFGRSRLYMRHQFRQRRIEFYEQFWPKVCENEGWEYENLGDQCFRIHDRNRFTYAVGAYLQIDSPAVLSIAGNKVLSRRLLEEMGAPVPAQVAFDLSRLAVAEQFLEEVGGNIVIKPAEGGGGAGVTTDVSKPAAIRKAAFKAATVYSSVVAEQQVQGANYRLLYLNGELIDAVRRDSPTVVGDGNSRISKLIDHENENRLTQESITALSPLSRDASVKFYLAQSGVSLQHVPAAGELFRVKTATNQNSARDNHRVIDRVHPYYRELGTMVAGRLGMQLLGLDVITESIEEPLPSSRGIVNEINGTPGFHHHELVYGQSGISHVAPRVLESILRSIGPAFSGMNNRQQIHVGSGGG